MVRFVVAVALATGIGGCENPESGEKESESVGAKSTASEPSNASGKQNGEETNPAGESGDRRADGGAVATGNCNEPPKCPEPDDSKPPELICYEPGSVPVGKEKPAPDKKAKIPQMSATVHIYGRHLVREDGPPLLAVFRPASSEGRSGLLDRDLEVRSPCHVVAELSLSNPTVQNKAGAGSALEFRLLREPPTEQQRETDNLGPVATDWHEIQLNN